MPIRVKLTPTWRWAGYRCDARLQDGRCCDERRLRAPGSPRSRPSGPRSGGRPRRVPRPTRVVGRRAHRPGTYVRDGQDAGLHVTGDSVLVADSRIDAPAPTGGSASELHHLLRHTGTGGLAPLAADFALACWEPSRGELTLARDAFGLRPLVWARRGS